MVESQQILLNPWLLHLQKLALELKCPLCLDLLVRPVLLPCNHIFCNCCIQGSTQFRSKCPACKSPYVDQEIRPAPYMENIVSIYRSLDATSLTTLIHPFPNDIRRCSELCPVLVKTNSDNGIGKEHNETAADGNSSNGNSLFPLSVNNCGLEIHVGDKPVFNSENRLTQFQSPGQVGHLKQAESGIEEIDMNQIEQLSPSCKHLLGDIDGSGSDPGSSRDVKRQKMSNSSDGSSGICAFCHSDDETNDTGPLLHYYANGKLVVGDVKPNSNVIHVHKICIDWTPQVYYEGDNIRNLESELARAAKLKCSGCGLKGAGLGCYMRSCRKSYHAPCAVKISGCRWDFDDFIMMCPTHKAVKFPREKKKSVKLAKLEAQPMPAQMAPKQANFLTTLPNGTKELVLCGSALSPEEKCYLVKFASSYGATVSRCWKPNVTHVIAATDVNGAYTRTLKVLMALLSGIWIVTIDWVKACREANKLVDEEAYEVSLDNHGCCGGPKAGRLRTSANAPKLFNSLNFYFSGDFLPAYRNDLLSLVRTAGGTVIETKEQLVAQSCNVQPTPSTNLVIYNVDPIQGSSFEDEVSVVLERLRAADDLARGIGCQVLKHTWILESIAACKLHPF